MICQFVNRNLVSNKFLYIWKIYSKSAEINKDNHEAILSQVTGYFFENDEPVFSIEAPLANINLETSNIQLKRSKSIAMFNQDPVNILADNLSWNSKPVEATIDLPPFIV